MFVVISLKASAHTCRRREAPQEDSTTVLFAALIVRGYLGRPELWKEGR